MKDAIITVDVGSDIDNFQHFLEMYAGSSIQSEDILHYFVSMAVLTISPNYRKSYLVDKVYGKVEHSMIEDFGRDYPRDKLDRIVKEWGMLADNVKTLLKDYLYDRNLNATITYRKYLGEGCIQVILHENNDYDD